VRILSSFDVECVVASRCPQEGEEAVEDIDAILEAAMASNGTGEDGADAVAKWHPRNPYQVRVDLPDLLAEELF
jgi:hypothetical protein